MKRGKLLLYIFLLFSVFSCQEKIKSKTGNRKQVVILIQPFKDLDTMTAKLIADDIKKIYPYVKILDAVDLPKEAFYKDRNRYRADTIISYLAKNTKNGFVKVGLTTKDISTNKGSVKDFGVMGLGYRPGKSCVASSFRLKKTNLNEQLFKVVIHEIGHTQGLPHCPEKSCFMRDAEGKNPTDEETDFCNNCKEFLKTKNWKFN